MSSARVNQTRLDDVILPVFCPTCQTNLLARRMLADQEDHLMSRTTSRQTSRSPADASSRDRRPHVDKAREMPETIVEEAGESEDRGRDLAQGEGGAIDLPTRPGDMSKDD
jgi:uncharacterized Zn finger protein (UPF0148 family)